MYTICVGATYVRQVIDGGTVKVATQLLNSIAISLDVLCSSRKLKKSSNSCDAILDASYRCRCVGCLAVAHMTCPLLTLTFNTSNQLTSKNKQ